MAEAPEVGKGGGRPWRPASPRECGLYPEAQQESLQDFKQEVSLRCHQDTRD